MPSLYSSSSDQELTLEKLVFVFILFTVVMRPIATCMMPNFRVLQAMYCFVFGFTTKLILLFFCSLSYSQEKLSENSLRNLTQIINILITFRLLRIVPNVRVRYGKFLFIPFKSVLVVLSAGKVEFPCNRSFVSFFLRWYSEMGKEETSTSFASCPCCACYSVAEWWGR